MLIIIATLYNVALPYWDVLRKELFLKGFYPVTIQFSHILFHPIGLVSLLFLGLFSIPTDLIFYLYWLLVVVFAVVSIEFYIRGLAKTKFFAIQTLASLEFILTTLAGIFIVGEVITFGQLCAIIIATTGVLFFVWPDNIKNNKFTMDTGVLLVLLSLIFGAISAACFKLAALNTPDAQTFLTGRFIGDILIWPIMWVMLVGVFRRKNPSSEMRSMLSTGIGFRMSLGFALVMIVGSWLVFLLPLTTMVVLGTLSIPVSYLWGHFKYQDSIPPRMGIGTMLVVGATLLFLFS